MGGGKQNKPKKDKARREEIKRRLKNELKKELKPLLIGTIAMITSAAANQAIPRLLGNVLDQNSSSSSANSIKPTKDIATKKSLMLVVLGGGLSSFLRTTMLNRAQDSIASRLRLQVFTKLMKRSIQWYQMTPDADDVADDVADEAATDTNVPNQHKRSPAEIQSILTNDVNTVSETITTTVINTIRSTKSVLFAVKNMLAIDPHLLSVSVAIVPIIGTSAVILNKFVKKIVQQQRNVSIECESFASERVDNINLVQISSRAQHEIESYSKMQQDVVQLGKKASWAKGVFMGFMFSASSAALLMVFHVGGRDVAKGRLTHGELKSFATYTFMLGLGTSGIMKGLGSIMQGMVCAERVYDLLDDDDDNDDDDDDVKEENTARTSEVTSHDNPADTVDSISVSNMSFTYASNSNTGATLKNINLDIKRGQVVVLVGSNGAGKSTLANLLVSLYKPQTGSILAKTSNDNDDMVDMATLDRKTQSQLVQLVPQNPAMFNMSILDNVKYTNPTATNKEVEKALENTNCTGFMSKLENGLNYMVGRNGSKLSGGQRQRIALARALLSNPALLILDEPNSSMDAEGENAIIDAVEACRRGNDDNGNRRGLLLISHRAASLSLADLIVVMKDGEIAEQGSYDELTKNKDSELCQLMPDLQ